MQPLNSCRPGLSSLPTVYEGGSQALRPILAFSMSLQEKVEMQRQRFRLEFEKYRGLLAQEEQLQLRRLEQEERATLQRLRDSKSRLGQQSRALKELAEELEDRCQRPALELLEVRPRRQAAACRLLLRGRTSRTY